MSWLKRYGQDLLTESGCGNAILVSLIIMASALTISLGLTTIVAGEIRSAGLTPPAERAYYKAESYVEQALWNRKVDNDYNVANVSDADWKASAATNKGYVCTNPTPQDRCFAKEPNTHPNLIKDFQATTSAFTQPTKKIKQDTEIVQLDVPSKTADGDRAKLTIPSVQPDPSNAQGFKGLEVTIVAYNKASGNAAFGSSGPSGTNTTPVFIDKKIAAAGTTFQYIFGEAANKNPVNESPPPFNTSQYRIRIKALGTGAEVGKPVVVSGGTNQQLPLRSPDYAVRAVAQDGPSRRGIQVVTPVAEQINPIFDFVLFSDLDLNKLDAKQKPESIDATVNAFAFSDSNRNCQYDANEATGPGLNNINVTLEGSGQPQEKTTNSEGKAAFQNVPRGVTYKISKAEGALYALTCPPPTVTPDAGNPTPTVNVPMQKNYELVPLHRYYGYYTFQGNPRVVTNHFYTTRFGEPSTPGFAYGREYRYQGVAGYIFSPAGPQPPGTVPLYRSYSAEYTDHLLTLEKGEGSPSWVDEGRVVGYVYPAGSCPAGARPLRRWWGVVVGNHGYYPEGENPNNFNPVDRTGGFADEGVRFCLLPSAAGPTTARP